MLLVIAAAGKFFWWIPEGAKPVTIPEKVVGITELMLLIAGLACAGMTIGTDPGSCDPAIYMQGLALGYVIIFICVCIAMGGIHHVLRKKQEEDGDNKSLEVSPGPSSEIEA